MNLNPNENRCFLLFEFWQISEKNKKRKNHADPTLAGEASWGAGRFFPIPRIMVS
jgi:hypothetical protein